MFIVPRVNAASINVKGFEIVTEVVNSKVKGFGGFVFFELSDVLLVTNKGMEDHFIGLDVVGLHLHLIHFTRNPFYCYTTIMFIHLNPNTGNTKFSASKKGRPTSAKRI